MRLVHFPSKSNAHSDEEAVVVIARTTQDAIVENLPELQPGWRTMLQWRSLKGSRSRVF